MTDNFQTLSTGASAWGAHGQTGADSGPPEQGYVCAYAADLGTWRALDGDQTILGECVLVTGREGYTPVIDPGDACDMPVIGFTSGMAPAVYNPAMPVAPPIPAGEVPVIVTARWKGTVLATLRTDHATARLVTLTSDFDHAQVEYYALGIRGRAANRSIHTTAPIGATITANSWRVARATRLA